MRTKHISSAKLPAKMDAILLIKRRKLWKIGLTQRTWAIKLFSNKLCSGRADTIGFESLFSAEGALKRLFLFHGGFDMLVLTRRIGEQIVIDGDILITVVAVQGNKTRIGITAPRAVRVDRQEISDRRHEFSGKPWRQRSSPATCKASDLSPAH